MSNLGNWFPELEHLKIGYFDHIGIAQPPSMAPLPASGKLQRLKSLHLKFLLFAIPEVDGLKSQDESNQVGVKSMWLTSVGGTLLGELPVLCNIRSHRSSRMWSR